MFLLVCETCGTKVAEYASSGWEEIADETWLCPACAAVARTPPSAERPRSDRREPRGFNEPEDGAQDRYRARRASLPWTQHTAWWLVHNVIAHPLIGVLPVRATFAFHDWTSRKMHGR